MKRLLIALTALWFVGLLSGRAEALTLSLRATPSTIAPGETTSVDLGISGVEPSSLGAFAVEVLFDDAVLQFQSLTYGTFLGNPSDPSETDIVTNVASGSISLDAISLLLASTLETLQPDAFVLATLTFNGIAVGSSALEFGTPLDLADGGGITLSPDLVPGSVTVASTTPIPLPGTIWLALAGLTGLGLNRRSRCRGGLSRATL